MQVNFYRETMSSITNVSIAILKQLFIMYGADSYDMSNNQEDQGNQTTHIETIYNYITTAIQVSFIFCINFNNLYWC